MLKGFFDTLKGKKIISRFYSRTKYYSTQRICVHRLFPGIAFDLPAIQVESIGTGYFIRRYYVMLKCVGTDFNQGKCFIYKCYMLMAACVSDEFIQGS